MWILWFIAAPTAPVSIYGVCRNGRRWAFATGSIRAHPTAFCTYIIAIVGERWIGGIFAKDLLISAFSAKRNGICAARTRRCDAYHLLMMADIARVVGHRFGMGAAEDRLISASLPFHHGQIGAILVTRHRTVASRRMAIGIVAFEIFVAQWQIAPKNAPIDDLNFDIATFARSLAIPPQFLAMIIP